MELRLVSVLFGISFFVEINHQLFNQFGFRLDPGYNFKIFKLFHSSYTELKLFFINPVLLYYTHDTGYYTIKY